MESKSERKYPTLDEFIEYHIKKRKEHEKEFPESIRKDVWTWERFITFRELLILQKAISAYYIPVEELQILQSSVIGIADTINNQFMNRIEIFSDFMKDW